MMSEEVKPPPMEFENVSQVKAVMNTLAVMLSGSKNLAGMGVLSPICAAIATLAEEIEKIKTEKGQGE